MKKKNVVILAIVLIVLVAMALVAYFLFKPAITAGEKELTVKVEHLDGSSNSFMVRTNEEYLRKALESESIIAGVESEYGLWIQTVDGETADETQQQWWGFTVNGEFSDYGVDTMPINNGDVIVFTLNVGY